MHCSSAHQLLQRYQYVRQAVTMASHTSDGPRTGPAPTTMPTLNRQTTLRPVKLPTRLHPSHGNTRHVIDLTK